MDKYKRYWSGDKLANLHPAGKDLVSENPGLFKEFSDLVHSLNCTSVVDFGCGRGRFRPAFNDFRYVGVDINPQAVEAATKAYPTTDFREVNIDSNYPVADLYFVFTVFLHLDDEVLAQILKRIRKVCKYLVVVECMDDSKRLGGETEPPTFHRSPDNNIATMKASGFQHLKTNDASHIGPDNFMQVYKSV